MLDPVLTSDSVTLRDYLDARILGLDHISLDRHEIIHSEIKRLDQLLSQSVLLSDSKFAAVQSAVILANDKIETQFKAVSHAQEQAQDLFHKQFLAVDHNQDMAKESIQQQFFAILKATDTATTSLDKRLEGMNEFRSQINDMAAKFINRADVDSAIKYLSERIGVSEGTIGNCITRQELNAQQNAMGERVSSLEKFSNNMQGRMWVIAAVVVIMEIALRFLSH